MCPHLFWRRGFSLSLLLILLLLSLIVFSSKAGAQVVSYTVGSGDTLWGVARAHGVTVEALARANGITDVNRIYPGQRLEIPAGNTQGVHVVARGDTLWDLSRRYGVSVAALQAANPRVDPQRLLPGTTLVLPGSGDSRQAAARGSISLAWPLQGTISSPYGPRQGGFHYGLDIAAPQGTAIRAARGGRVVYSGWKGTYGQTVILDHGNGMTTLYAHASRLLVSRGQWVNTGQAIARVGSTGRSTGPHLHFEIRINDQPVNPSRYLR